MKKKAIKALKFIAFLIIGLVIFWLIYKDQDIERIKGILKNDVNYMWIWVSLFFGLLSHISRSIRWNLLIETLGSKPRITNTFLAVMVGYLMNIAFPRMGEISRCGVLSRYENISFTKLIGTVVIERIIDVIMLLLLTLLVIVTQFGHVLRFIHNNPEIEEKINSFIQSPYLYVGLVVLIILFFVYRKAFKRTKLYQKIEGTINNFKEGLRSFKNIKRKGAFIFHTIFIYLMYYLMFYVVFFCFDFTSHLSLMAGLTSFVLASYGMVAPVQGGIGAWHFMAKEALKLYGIANENGIIFALLNHTAMTAMLIVFGLISFMVLPFINRKMGSPKQEG